MIDTLLCALAWIVILLSIARGYRKSRTVDRYALLTWSIFMAIGLVFTFKTPLVTDTIDELFGEYPVAYWLKALATLAAVLFYSISLRSDHSALRLDHLFGWWFSGGINPSRILSERKGHPLSAICPAIL